MLKIDLESHFYTHEMLDAFSARTEPPCFDKASKRFTYSAEDAIIPLAGFFYDALSDLADKRLEQMDRNHIDMAVLSASAGLENLPPETSVPLARTVNNAVAAAVKAHPGRLIGSAILPVRSPEAACAELERCVKEYGFVAWHVHSNFGDSYPDDPQYFPIFRKAEELGVYVYLHPSIPSEGRFHGYGFGLISAGLGFTVDTMTTAVRMILSGLLDQCPNLKIVMGHLGEALPFLLDRMDNRFSAIPEPRQKNRHSFGYYFKEGNILVTTSGNMSKEAFACTQAVLGIDRILFASDYPYEVMDDIVNFVNTLPISEADRQKVYGRNARHHLGIG